MVGKPLDVYLDFYLEDINHIDEEHMQFRIDYYMDQVYLIDLYGSIDLMDQKFSIYFLFSKDMDCSTKILQLLSRFSSILQYWSVGLQWFRWHVTNECWFFKTCMGSWFIYSKQWFSTTEILETKNSFDYIKWNLIAPAIALWIILILLIYHLGKC